MQTSAGANKSRMRSTSITMSHGSGGKDMRELIEDVFVSAFDNDQLTMLEDQARFSLGSLANHGDRLAFTTDSYVVHPLFFPGGNIGTLAVNGTINDLAVSGATPLYLSCSLIIEEGFAIDQLCVIVDSMKHSADRSGVKIVTGDTKVVQRNAADKLFINTTGIGVIPSGIDISSRRAVPGDVVIINGFIGEHGAAILSARGDLHLESEIKSDTSSLSGLVEAMLDVCPDIHCMRDATRGGVATVLNEIASASRVCIRINESDLPVQEEVRGFCEILGLDPLYLANEGKIVAIVPGGESKKVLKQMQNHEHGRGAQIIGEVTEQPSGFVVLRTTLGGQRMIDTLVGDQLPRIC